MSIAHQRINDILEKNMGSALIPILERFKHLSPKAYQDTATALWEAYREGLIAAKEIVNNFQRKTP